MKVTNISSKVICIGSKTLLPDEDTTVSVMTPGIDVLVKAGYLKADNSVADKKAKEAEKKAKAEAEAKAKAEAEAKAKAEAEAKAKAEAAKGNPENK